MNIAHADVAPRVGRRGGQHATANATSATPATRQTAVAMPDASQSSSQKVTAAGRISKAAPVAASKIAASLIRVFSVTRAHRIKSHAYDGVVASDIFCRCHCLTGGLRHSRRSLRTISRPRSGIQVAHVSSMFSASPRPIPGDFLLHRVSHWTGVLLVGLDRDQPELSCQTYSAALAHAQRGAVRANVDVWQTTDGTLFERLASYRLS